MFFGVGSSDSWLHVSARCTYRDDIDFRVLKHVLQGIVSSTAMFSHELISGFNSTAIGADEFSSTNICDRPRGNLRSFRNQQFQKTNGHNLLP